MLVDRRYVWPENYLLNDIGVCCLLAFVSGKTNVTSVDNRGLHGHL